MGSEEPKSDISTKVYNKLLCISVISLDYLSGPLCENLGSCERKKNILITLDTIGNSEKTSKNLAFRPLIWNIIVQFLKLTTLKLLLSDARLFRRVI